MLSHGGDLDIGIAIGAFYRGQEARKIGIISHRDSIYAEAPRSTRANHPIHYSVIQVVNVRLESISFGVSFDSPVPFFGKY